MHNDSVPCGVASRPSSIRSSARLLFDVDLHLVLEMAHVLHFKFFISHPAFVKHRREELADHLVALSAVVTELSAFVPHAQALRCRADA